MPAYAPAGTGKRPSGCLHSLWVLLRSVAIVAALSFIALRWGPVVQASEPLVADLGIAAVSGVVVAALCPELWMLAAPIPVLIPLVQAFHAAQTVSPYWGDEHDGIIWLVGAVYVAIAIVAGALTRRIVRVALRSTAR